MTINRFKELKHRKLFVHWQPYLLYYFYLFLRSIMDSNKRSRFRCRLTKIVVSLRFWSSWSDFHGWQKKNLWFYASEYLNSVEKYSKFDIYIEKYLLLLFDFFFREWRSSNITNFIMTFILNLLSRLRERKKEIVELVSLLEFIQIESNEWMPEWLPEQLVHLKISSFSVARSDDKLIA